MVDREQDKTSKHEEPADLSSVSGPARDDGPTLFGRATTSVDCNVLCVSRHGIGRYFGKEGFDSSWHDPITGPVTIRLMQDSEAEEGVPVTVALFDGKKYPVLYHRTGLSSSVHCVGILNPDDASLPVWDLYLDLPLPGCEIGAIPQRGAAASKPNHDTSVFMVGEKIDHASLELEMEITAIDEKTGGISARITRGAQDTNLIGQGGGREYVVGQAVEFVPSWSLSQGWQEKTDAPNLLMLLPTEDGGKLLSTL